MAFLDEGHVFKIDRQGQRMKVEFADAKSMHVERGVSFVFNVLPHWLIGDCRGEQHQGYEGAPNTPDPLYPTCNDRVSRHNIDLFLLF